MEENPNINERKEKIKNWIKDPYNLALLAVLVFAAVILLYFFFMTKSQALWWDEAEYMATAKNWAFGYPYDINPQRPPLFPFLAAILFKIGLGELSIKFLLDIVPAFLVVLITYLLVKEMYNKKVALIASFITSVSWIHLFYSVRFMTDALGLLFGLLAFYFFWKGWVKNENKNYLLLIGFFIALSFMCRLTGILYGAIIVFFLLITLQFEAIKSKHMWAVFPIFLLTISPYLIWSKIYYNNALAFRSGYGGITTSSLGWQMINHVYDYPELIFFITFLIGLVFLIPMFISIDKILSKKMKEEYPNIFMISSILFTLAFFIYFLRTGENRWLIMMSPGIFAISALGISWIYDLLIKNFSKKIVIILVLLIIFGGAYYQLNHANMIIKNKLNSYSDVKESGLWMRDNTNPGDVVFSRSMTQIAYYSERRTYTFARFNESEFDELINKTHPKFMMESLWEPNPADWGFNLPKKYEAVLVPVKVWYLDNQPSTIVYQFKYNQ